MNKHIGALLKVFTDNHTEAHLPPAEPIKPIPMPPPPPPMPVEDVAFDMYQNQLVAKIMAAPPHMYRNISYGNNVWTDQVTAATHDGFIATFAINSLPKGGFYVSFGDGEGSKVETLADVGDKVVAHCVAELLKK